MSDGSNISGKMVFCGIRGALLVLHCWAVHSTAGAALTVVEMGDHMVPRMLNETAGTMLKNWCEAGVLCLRIDR